MALEVEIGPYVSMGNANYPTTATGLPIATEEIDLEAGPNLAYQGEGIIDPRFYVQKDYAANRQGSILATLNSPYFLSCDKSPATAAAANIAAAQAATTGVGLTLVTAASAGINTNVPFFPFKSSTLTLAPIALDFGCLGFTVNAAVDTLSITSGSTTATASSLLAASNFYPGQWLIMPNSLSATTTLITQVVSVTGTTIVLTVAPGVTTTTAAVGSANIPNANWIGQPTPTATQPYWAGGVGGFLNPKEAIVRGVSVTANAAATGGVVQIKGWDLYGQPQTENITSVAATTVNGKKTWKYILSATPQFTDAGHTYSVGTTDIFGFAVRSDRWEYTNIFWNGAFATSSAGWTAADLTTPATTTTGDVRGTVAVASLVAPVGAASDGIKRLALFASIPLYNLTAATPATPQPLYGVFPV